MLDGAQNIQFVPYPEVSLSRFLLIKFCSIYFISYLLSFLIEKCLLAGPLVKCHKRRTKD